MAASTTVVTIDQLFVFGNKRVHMVNFACSSYGTDGIIITAALCGLNILDYAIPFYVGGGAVANVPVNIWWDKTNGLLMLYTSSNVGTAASTVITTAGSIYVLAIGS